MTTDVTKNKELEEEVATAEINKAEQNPDSAENTDDGQTEQRSTLKGTKNTNEDVKDSEKKSREVKSSSKVKPKREARRATKKDKKIEKKSVYGENDNIHTGSLLDEMDTSNKNLQNIGVELLPVHAGGTVHAKRMGGTFRKVKTYIIMAWSIFFLAPYLQWDGRQAILFDLAERKFYIFWLTILPQDIWVLAMILLFASLALAAVTAIAGRAWCGYACFQTVWQDVFTWLEEYFEGSPNKRIKMDEEPWSWKKIKPKLPKWLVWAFIAFMTSFSFVAFFDPALDLWYRLFLLEWTATEASIVLILGGLTFFFAGVLREQTCMGFCPYSRIQSAMIDTETLVPAYDQDRGEPRGRVQRAKKGEPEPPPLGDCIDCNLCVAVCPTGVDIRLGQQFGCITCGLCIDACDSVMDKIKKPRGLIRYASLEEFAGKHAPPIHKRPRVIVYTGIMGMAASIILWGLLTMAPVDLKVLHERAPLFVSMSDGTIQNKYYIKVVNKSDKPMKAVITVDGPDTLTYSIDKVMNIEPGNIGNATLLVRIPKRDIDDTNMPVTVIVKDPENEYLTADYVSKFFSPRRR